MPLLSLTFAYNCASEFSPYSSSHSCPGKTWLKVDTLVRTDRPHLVQLSSLLGSAICREHVLSLELDLTLVPLRSKVENPVSVIECFEQVYTGLKDMRSCLKQNFEALPFFIGISPVFSSLNVPYEDKINMTWMSVHFDVRRPWKLMFCGL